MIPSKIRRVIVVGRDEWEYCVRGSWGNVSVFLHNMRTNGKLDWYAEGEGIEITPSRIKTLIEKKELWGKKAHEHRQLRQLS